MQMYLKATRVGDTPTRLILGLATEAEGVVPHALLVKDRCRAYQVKNLSIDLNENEKARFAGYVVEGIHKATRGLPDDQRRFFLLNLECTFAGNDDITGVVILSGLLARSLHGHPVDWQVPGWECVVAQSREGLDPG